jgi:hypothetical protein
MCFIECLSSKRKRVQINLQNSYLLTYSMEHSSSSEANRFSAREEIPRILRNPKVHYRSYNCPPPVPILSQFDLVHNPTTHFLKTHLNIVLPSSLGLPSGLFPSGFPHQNLVYASPLPYTRYPICATCPAHLILLDCITRSCSTDLRFAVTLNLFYSKGRSRFTFSIRTPLLEV